MLFNDKGKRTFKNIAEKYDQYRPGYPLSLMQALKDRADLREASTILEIGCGTGQLTKQLLTTGAHITAIDPSADMIRIAEQNFQNASIKFICQPFEEHETESTYHLITAATSFHWLDKETRLTKAHSLLCDNGKLAIIQNMGKRSSLPFYPEIKKIYEEVVPDDIMKQKKTVRSITNDMTDELNASKLFNVDETLSFDHEMSLQADEYVSFLDTLSFDHNLQDDIKSRLFDRIHQFIIKYGGTMPMPYTAMMIIAKKIA